VGKLVSGMRGKAHSSTVRGGGRELGQAVSEANVSVSKTLAFVGCLFESMYFVLGGNHPKIGGENVLYCRLDITVYARIF